jgi:hypothetical protein
MGTTNLLENGEVVLAVQRGLLHGGRDLQTLPRLLCRLLEGDLWRERVIPQSGQRQDYGEKEFDRFVSEPLPEGLGSDVDTLRRLCNAAGPPEGTQALDLIDAKSQRPRGRPGTNGNIVTILEGRPEGNTRQKALRRLRKDRPDLHDRVLAGELSPNAAMREAGFRRRVLSMPLEPQALAKTLRRHLDAEQLAELVIALQNHA